MNKKLKIGLFLALLLVFSSGAFAQKNKIEGVWLTGEKTGRVAIYKARNGKFYGEIVWLKEPNRNGAPKTDEKNASAGLSTRPIMGLLVLKDFEQVDKDTYEGGTIYDPENGKTYDCKITYKDSNTLAIRGYIGISLIGRTEIWVRGK